MIHWKPLLDALEAGDEQTVRSLSDAMHPADAAAFFGSLNDRDRHRIAGFMSAQALDLVATFLEPSEAADLFHGVPLHRLGDTLNGLPDDVLVDILQELEPELREDYFLLLSDEKRALAAKLLSFPEESAGGRMTTAMATVREDMTIRQAIEELGAKKEETEVLSRIYVVDDEGHILGKVRLRDLAFNSRSMLVRDIMDDERLAINAHADQEEAVAMMRKYNLIALPVVSDHGRLLGVITHDDAMDIQAEESTEDIERMSAIGGTRDDEGYLRSSVAAHLQRRFFWILGLAFIGILSGIVLYNFEGILASQFLLAVFVPMVVATGGNTGAQAATMVIRAMSLDEFTPSAYLKVLWKEFRIGLFMGALVGVIVASAAYVFIHFFAIPRGIITISGGLGIGRFAMTIGIALASQVTVSASVGASLPILARVAKLDPAVVASPAITTIVDIIGMLIYFGLAKQILHL
jgi:magnesium transporter